jgi:hypothetical protein
MPETNHVCSVYIVTSINLRCIALLLLLLLLLLCRLILSQSGCSKAILHVIAICNMKLNSFYPAQTLNAFDWLRKPYTWYCSCIGSVHVSHRIVHSTLMLGRCTYFALISSVCVLSVVVLRSAVCYRNASLHKMGFPPPVFLSCYYPVDSLLRYCAIRDFLIITLW